MKQKTTQTRSRWLLATLLSLLMTLGGTSSAWAQTTENFESLTVDGTTLSNGWFVQGGTLKSTVTSITKSSHWDNAGSYNYEMISQGANGTSTSICNYESTNTNKYLIIPVEVTGKVKFYAGGCRTSGTRKAELYRVTYNSGTDTYTIGTKIGSTVYPAARSGTAAPNWLASKQQIDLGEDHTMVAFLLQGSAIDEVEYTEYVSTPYVAPASISVVPSTNSANVTWTAGVTDETVTAWNLEYKKNSIDDWTEVHGIAAGTLSYEITGLDDNQNYDVRVKAIYATEESTWKTTTFKTQIGSYPWSEDFTGLTSGIPDGWDNTEGTTTVANYKWTYYNNGHTAAPCLRFDSYTNSNNNTNFLKTPVMNFVQNSSMQLKFWYKNPVGGDFSVYISNDGGATYTEELATGLTGASSWTEKTIDLPTDTYYENVVIVFKGTSNWGSGDAYIYLDDVLVKENNDYAMSVSGGDVVGSTIAFGTVKNTTTTKTFTISNDGSEDLTSVSVVSSDAEVFTVSETGFNIAAGETKDITVTFVKDVENDYSKTITISQANIATPIVLTVTATYVTPTPATMAVTLDEVAVGETVAFGTVNKATVKTFKVTNTGEATLNATIAITGTDAAKFTPSTTSLVVAGESNETFTITFNSDDVDVAKTAIVTLSAAGLSDVAFNVTGTYSDFWTEDFAAGTLPTGWVASTWTIGTFSDYENNTTMALAPSGSSAGTITTPRLSAKAGDVLTWDGYFNWYDEAMTVEWSNDGETGWTKIYDAYKAQEDVGSTRYSHKAMSFTAPANGNYYLRFTSTYRNGVDNFSGFKLNPKTHDASITAKSIPASGSQYVDYTATVTVNELLGKNDEVVTAELWIDATKVATEADVTLNASASKVISLTFTPATAMSGDAVIKVYNGDNSIDLTSDVQAVTITEALVLDETVDPAISSTGVKPSVVVKYNAKNGWNTICMPFALTTDIMNSIFGTGWQAFEFYSYTDGNLGFRNPSSFYAGYPYLVYVETAAVHAEGVKLFDVNIAIDTPNYDQYGGATFQGIYAPIAAGNWQSGWYGVTPAGKIAPGNTSTSSMKGFRAYFTGITAGARLSFYDETTGITTIIDAKELSNDGKVYNLNGQRVENAHKGLYIVNGKKVVVK